MAQARMVVGELVDLNTARADALIGVSEMVAESIIDFRDASGGFASVEDLTEIECLSEVSYQRIRLMVTV